MSDQSAPGPQTVAELQARLRQLSASIREADHLDSSTQLSLARLLDELTTQLNSNGVELEKTTRLAEAVSDVARSLHEPHSAGLIESASLRLQEVAARAEVEAPVATSVVYRFIDVLANMGI